MHNSRQAGRCTVTLVVVHTNPIGPEKKRRIEESLVAALAREGFPASQAVFLFQEGSSHLSREDRLPGAPSGPAVSKEISPEFKTRARRTKAELMALKSQLMDALQTNGTLTSFQARQLLDLADCNWAPPALRRIFGELERQGLVVQHGLKRNTCYVWKGPRNQAC